MAPEAKLPSESPACEPDEAGAAPAEPEKVSMPQRLSRRLVRLLPVLGAAVALGSLLPHLPKERQVELRLEHPDTVTAVELTWLDRRDASQATPVQGGAWRFSPGAAPRFVSTTVKLPDGAYDLEITVERAEGRDALHRSVTLGDSDRITLPLR